MSLAPRLRWLLAGFGVVLLWSFYVGYSGIQAARSASEGRDLAEQLTGDYSAEQLLRGEGDDQLGATRDAFDDAAGRLNGAAFAPIRVLPWLGRQTRSAAALTAAGRDVADLGLELTAVTGPMVRQLDTKLLEQADALETLAPVLRQLHTDAAAIDLGPSQALIGRLSEARADFSEKLADLLDVLDRSADAALGVSDLLRGPTRYLLFAANNSQMQSGAGKLLSVGVLTIEDGDFFVSDVASVASLDAPAEPVSLEADFEERWGWLNPGQVWANLGLTPRFDVTASTALAMWEAVGMDPVDGVVVVDPAALSAVLRASGPIEIDGSVFDSESILSDLLHDQYYALGDAVYEDWRTVEAEQEVRRDRLANIAAAIVTIVTSEDVDRLAVLVELADAARGRHILLYSRDHEQQAAWRAAELSGEMGPDSVMLSLLNRSATKADFFMRLEAQLEVTQHEDRVEGVVTVRVTNNVPLGEPKYVAGPHPELGLEYGDYLGILALNLPGVAVQGRVDDDLNLAVAGGDGPTRVVGSWITVPRGETVTRVFRFDLPSQYRELQIEPSARVPAIMWAFDGEVFDDKEPRQLHW